MNYDDFCFVNDRLINAIFERYIFCWQQKFLKIQPLTPLKSTDTDLLLGLSVYQMIDYYNVISKLELVNQLLSIGILDNTYLQSPHMVISIIFDLDINYKIIYYTDDDFDGIMLTIYGGILVDDLLVVQAKTIFIVFMILSKLKSSRKAYIDNYLHKQAELFVGRFVWLHAQQLLGIDYFSRISSDYTAWLEEGYTDDDFNIYNLIQ